MDEELRKALRTLERAGIKDLTPYQDFIISKALELLKEDASSWKYVSGTVQATLFSQYAENRNSQNIINDPVNQGLIDRFRYYLGLVRFLTEDAKDLLNR